MKKIIVAVAALLFIAATFAQTTTPPPSGGAHKAAATPDERAKRETDKINTLTPLGDAYQKVLAVNKQDDAKRESITNGAKRSDLTDDQKSQLKALRETHKANLKTAMGADLFAKYEAALKAQREQKKGEGGGGHSEK
jgi:hypothetical protein